MRKYNGLQSEKRAGLQHINRIRTNTLPVTTMDYTSLQGTNGSMPVSVVAGDHQRRVNTSTRQVLVLEVEIQLETRDRRRWSRQRNRNSFRIFTLSNQFNQMDLH